MGMVFLAHDTKLGRDVALKVLPDGVLSQPEQLSRFRREAQVRAALNHPNIAALFLAWKNRRTRRPWSWSSSMAQLWPIVCGVAPCRATGSRDLSRELAPKHTSVFSRGAATECSPGRKPGVGCRFGAPAP